jgi:MYXO-CTERM domain-containing protein
MSFSEKTNAAAWICRLGFTVVLILVTGCSDQADDSVGHEASSTQQIESSIEQSQYGTLSEESHAEVHDAAELRQGAILSQVGYGFTLEAGIARATVLASGQNVALHPNGQLAIEQTPTHSLQDGRLATDDWRFKIRLDSISRQKGVGPELGKPAKMHIDGSSVRFDYDSGASLFYNHSPQGLEQRIEIPKRPKGTDDLRIGFETPKQFKYKVEEHATSVRVFEEDKEVLGWRGLKVWDADDKRVGAKIIAKPGTLEYQISDAEAQYPLTIDPLSTAPDWQTSSSQGFSAFGRVTTVVGDVNNDTFDDVIIGQPLYSNQHANEGRALLFLGSSSGLSSVSSWAVEADQAGAQLGISATGIGDIDADTYDDVVLGAFDYDANAVTDSGGAFLYRGNANGLNLTSSWSDGADTVDSNFGYGVAGHGDVNCDGIPDLAVGAPSYDLDGDGTGSGRVYVYYGATTSPYFSVNPDLIDESSNGDSFGRNVVLGNFDGDVNGCADVLAGAANAEDTLNNEGRAAIYLGSTSGVSTTSNWEVYGAQAAASLGSSVAAVDVNGDGIDDAIVGAYRYDGAAGTNSGQVRVYHGSSSGPSSADDWSFEADQAGALFGDSVIGIDDINQDGFGDVVVAATQYTDQVTKEGAAFGFLGSANGLSTSPVWKYFSGESNARLGLMTLSVGGDVNGDGYGDLVIASILGDGAVVDGGVASAFYGQPSCYIGGVVYQPDEANPNNTCEVCDPAQSVDSWTVKADGETCDDGSACTSNDTCQSGTCQGGQTTTCNDNNPCTSDVCDVVTGQCVADPTQDGASCPDDGLSCTSDLCSSGVCEHPINNGSCVINGSCYADGDLKPTNSCLMCDASAAQTGWTPTSAGSSCEDGSFCTVNDTCDGSGSCSAGSARDCSSAVTECTTGAICSEVAASCLTTGDKADGTTCDDSNGCTTNDQCTDGTCGGDTVACNNPNPCEAGSCDPSTGNCTFTAIANGTACVPASNACQVGVCSSGVCSTTGTISCEDNNPCTADSCDASTGCQNLPLSAGDACGQAACVDDTTAAPAATCNDSASCQQPANVDCGAFRCSSGACRTSCSTDGHCADDAWCDLSTNECSTDNRVPEADAGNNQIAAEGMSVTLDGTGSTDADGDALTYRWDQISGTAVTLDDDESSTPEFTAPASTGSDADDELIFELVVNDGTDDSEPDTVTVLLRDSDNAAPTAVVTGPDEAEGGQTITLSGADSADPDGDDLQFRWSRASGRPLPILGDNDAVDFEITFPEVTTETSYSFLLLVNDGSVNSNPAIHEVVVTPAVTGGDAGGDAGGDTGSDTGGDVGADAGDTGNVDQPIENKAGDLSGSSCACDSVQKEQPTNPIWLLGAMFLGGFAVWRRRRWIG